MLVWPICTNAEIVVTTDGQTVILYEDGTYLKLLSEQINRPAQKEAESLISADPKPNATVEYIDLVARLRGAVAERPDDLKGNVLLARSEVALGNYVAAYEAQERVVSLKGDNSTSKDYADLADMLILAAGGYVSPEAERVLESALSRDPQNGVAQYYIGLMMAQTGRPNVTVRLWDQLLRQSSAEASWVKPILDNIGEVADLAGVPDYTLPNISGLPIEEKNDPADLSETSEQRGTPPVE